MKEATMIETIAPVAKPPIRKTESHTNPANIARGTIKAKAASAKRRTGSQRISRTAAQTMKMAIVLCY